MSKSRMRRISKEMDDYLQNIARELSNDLRRPVSITDASRILAATRPTPVVVKSRRREIRVGKSLISL